MAQISTTAIPEAAPGASRVWEKTPTGIDWPRIRFTSCVAVYGASIGAATVLIHFLALTPYPNIIQHLTIWDSLMFGMGGVLAGLAVTAPTAYWLFGALPEFSAVKKRPPRGVRAWVLLGFGYGLLVPLAVGGVFIPVSYNLTDFAAGAMSIPQLMFKSLEGVLFAPSVALVIGSRLFYTALWSVLLFAPGGWIIDRFNASRDPLSVRYGTWAVTALLCAMVFAILIYAPPSFLANFGGGAQVRP